MIHYDEQREAQHKAIEEYVFIDDNIEQCETDGDSVTLCDADYDISSIFLNKRDVIALAKHFKLTKGDLL
jgi:hypothetical protein